MIWRFSNKMEDSPDKKEIFKSNLRRFLRIFVFVFIVVFIILNSAKVSGMFNYGLVYSNFVKDYLSRKVQENQINNSYPFAAIPEKSSLILPSSTPSPSNTPVAPSANPAAPAVSQKPTTAVIANSFIEIPKIGIKVPIVFQSSTSKKDLENALKKGVVHYPTSALPGQNGAVMIAGHSAPTGWKRNYDWAFSKINELTVGSEIFIYYNNQKFRYTVTKQFFLTPGATIPVSTTFADSLYLSTCWPPGQSKSKRLIVEAQGQW